MGERSGTVQGFRCYSRRLPGSPAIGRRICRVRPVNRGFAYDGFDFIDSQPLLVCDLHLSRLQLESGIWCDGNGTLTCFFWPPNHLMQDLIFPHRDILLFLFLLSIISLYRMVRDDQSGGKRFRTASLLFLCALFPVSSFAYSIDRGYFLTAGVSYLLSSFRLYLSGRSGCSTLWRLSWEVSLAPCASVLQYGGNSRPSYDTLLGQCQRSTSWVLDSPFNSTGRMRLCRFS